MSSFPLEHADLLHVEDSIWVLSAPTGVPNYDFQFDRFFQFRRPWQPPENISAIARLGAFPNYDTVFEALKLEGTTLVNTPEEYRRATELPCWYPLIEDLTPASVWFPGFPSLEDVVAHFSWPIFMKGTRQTSRHRRELSIIRDSNQFNRVGTAYATDPILRSQGVACRQFVPLRLVEDNDSTRLPSSFEFRTFWWKGALVGYGRYWWEGKAYKMTPDEEAACLAVAQDAALRICVPFLVVDVAQTVNGKWIVIECNDGQERSRRCRRYQPLAEDHRF
jgi:ATP-grasp domain, R2K clade family 3